jgi:hypothetical protein
MHNKLSIQFLFLITTVTHFQFNDLKEVPNQKNIVGSYSNKVKVSHFKESLQLLKDSSFYLTTQYEWSKYDYKGKWELKTDTLILTSATILDSSNEKYFSSKWLVKEKTTELILLSNQNYSLKKNN